jgi:hypothetical protein
MSNAKTQTPLISEYNGLTGEVTTRELTADEIADREAQTAEAAAQQAAQETRAAARASALAKLAELGLTADEIAAL